jgi:hypothetical protein
MRPGPSCRRRITLASVVMSEFCSWRLVASRGARAGQTRGRPQNAAGPPRILGRLRGVPSGLKLEGVGRGGEGGLDVGAQGRQDGDRHD